MKTSQFLSLRPLSGDLAVEYFQKSSKQQQEQQDDEDDDDSATRHQINIKTAANSQFMTIPAGCTGARARGQPETTTCSQSYLGGGGGARSFAMTTSSYNFRNNHRSTTNKRLKQSQCPVKAFDMMTIPLNKQDRLRNSLLLNIQSSNDYSINSSSDHVPDGAGRLSSLHRAQSAAPTKNCRNVVASRGGGATNISVVGSVGPAGPGVVAPGGL